MLDHLSWRRLTVLFALLAGLAGHAPVQAEQEYYFGWFGRVPDIEAVEPMVEQGLANVILPYNWKMSPEQVQAYLDEAEKQGVEVMVEVPRIFIKEDRMEDVEAFVKRFDDHPAVLGWYTADEPSTSQKWSVDLMERVYDAVKQQSDKPVYICFSYGETMRGRPVEYKDAFDVFMINGYPYRTGNPEFEGMQFDDWKRFVERASDLSLEIGKPWWNTLQCTGQVPYNTKRNFRFPTYGETQYQLYASVLNGAEGVIYWAYYVMLNSTGHEDYTYPSDDVYPHGPDTWFEEIFKPIAQVFTSIRHTVTPDNLVDQVKTTGAPGVLLNVYRDSRSKGHILVALNQIDDEQVLSVDLPFEVDSFRRLDSGSAQVLELGDQRLSLRFPPNQAVVLRVK